jgi:hypothetical protein
LGQAATIEHFSVYGAAISRLPALAALPLSSGARRGAVPRPRLACPPYGPVYNALPAAGGDGRRGPRPVRRALQGARTDGRSDAA